MSRFSTCPKCRALLEPKLRACPYCGTDVRHVSARGPAADARHTARIASWILGANLLVYIAMVAIDPLRGDQDGLVVSPSHRAVFLFGANQRSCIENDGQYWRLVSSMFLHYDLLHLVLNSVALAILATVAAHTFGAWRTVAIYFASGVVGGFASYINLPGGLATSAGASGAICGLISALAVYGKRRGGPPGEQLTRSMIRWGILIVVFGLLVPGIDNAGHIGGFFGGAACGWLAAGVRAVGGRADRLWRAAGVACIAGVLAVAGVWMAPSALRGLDSLDAEGYHRETGRALESLGRVLGGDDAPDKLPQRLGTPAGGGEEVGRLVAAALTEARRDPRSDRAAESFRAAQHAWLRWGLRLSCLYGIGYEK